jgi:predicted enzyme related to lactoylglutathione lyase
MAERRPPADGMVLTHFIVSDDVERSRRFYTEVLGGTLERSGEPTNIALANSWIVINGGGGPTDDKPAVSLETPPDLDRVSSFLNIRVKDIEAVYAEWSARGAQFLTPPKQHPYETRCYIRDPDGHLIEVGQTTDSEGDWTPPQWLPTPTGPESKLEVTVVSPEEAEYGVAEFWAGETLFGFTRLENGELVLRIEPRNDGAAVVVGAHSLAEALAHAKQLLESS